MSLPEVMTAALSGSRARSAAAPRRTGRSGARTTSAPTPARRFGVPRTLLRDRQERTRATRPAGERTGARTRDAVARRSLRPQSGFETVAHRREGVVGLPQRRLAGRAQHVEFAASTAALRDRLTDPRAKQALALEPVERRVDGADRDVASRAGVNLLADGCAVCFVGKPQHAEQDELFEIAERRTLRFSPHCG